MRRLGLGLTIALCGLPTSRVSAQADSAVRRPFSFAVLGHIRGEQGELNPKLGELLDHVRALHPDFVVLTGDIVWGDLFGNPPDTAKVRREWEAVDSALATLRVPVYRVPGNHDISDLGTKRVWWQRYGAVPRVLERFGSRFLLVGTAWIPADQDTVRQVITRPAALDSGEVAWLTAQLARPRAEHTFLLMHHLLWWDPDAPWWKQIHPLLHPAGVDIVFGGDYGPLKFSQLKRDSVLYLQASMEGIMPLKTLQVIARARVLSAQFDNFLLVKVDGPTVNVAVEILGEWSSPQYQPEFAQAMLRGSAPPPATSGWRKWVEYFSAKKLIALAGLMSAAFFAGFLIAKRRAT